jgi:ABC-type branched-subunit amino acid transport system substrate-binding protein
MVLPDATEGPAGAVSRGALQGATFAEEEFGFNAMLLGIELELLIEQAGSPAEAVAAFGRLAEQEVTGVAGGFDHATTLALSQAAAEAGIPFLNLTAPSDALRNAECSRFTFHVAPSAAMYLDALGGWFVRAGFRDWFIVSGDDEESRSQLERIRWTLREKHFGVREAGSVTLAGGGAAEAAASAARVNADLVLLLLPAAQQLEFLAEYEAAGAPTPVTGMPYPEAQTREFFLAAAAASPTTGSGHRAVAWAATLDAYGARELNARYLARWNEPMELSGWAAYQAVKILFEGSSFSGGATGRELVDFLAAETTVFDIWKGIGASFRPWDHQLRQSLYLIEIDPAAERPLNIELLVGELPAIYLPGTDPVERLDQLGDLAAKSSCSF